MPNQQPLEVYQGTNVTITLTARDANNAVQNLTGLTLGFVAGRRPSDPENRSPIFTKTGTTISATAGTFSVAITPTDTQDMAGDYQYQAESTDSSGNIVVVCFGRFTVKPTMLAS